MRRRGVWGVLGIRSLFPAPSPNNLNAAWEPGALGGLAGVGLTCVPVGEVRARVGLEPRARALEALAGSWMHPRVGGGRNPDGDAGQYLCPVLPSGLPQGVHAKDPKSGAEQRSLWACVRRAA